MERYRRLFAALEAIFGKGYVSKLMGKQSNVITLPDKQARKFLDTELNIMEASEGAVKKGVQDLNNLVSDTKRLSTLNDQELLTITNNAERLAVKVNPPAPPPAPTADVLSITTKVNKNKDPNVLIDEYNKNLDLLSQVDEEGGTLIGYQQFQKLQNRNNEIEKILESLNVKPALDEVKPEGIVIPFTKKPKESGIKSLKQEERAIEDYVDDAGGVNKDDPRGLDDFFDTPEDPEGFAKGGVASKGLDYLAGIERRGYQEGTSTMLSPNEFFKTSDTRKEWTKIVDQLEELAYSGQYADPEKSEYIKNLEDKKNKLYDQSWKEYYKYEADALNSQKKPTVEEQIISPEDALTPPASDVDPLQQHFEQNQMLKDAVARGEITPEQYNVLGGYDVQQTLSPGNPVLGGIGNLIGSTGYNIAQSLIPSKDSSGNVIYEDTPFIIGEDANTIYSQTPKASQLLRDIPRDVMRNVQGGLGLISPELKQTYQDIVKQKLPYMDQYQKDYQTRISQVDPNALRNSYLQNLQNTSSFDTNQYQSQLRSNLNPKGNEPQGLDYLTGQ